MGSQAPYSYEQFLIDRSKEPVRAKVWRIASSRGFRQGLAAGLIGGGCGLFGFSHAIGGVLVAVVASMMIGTSTMRVA